MGRIVIQGVVGVRQAPAEPFRSGGVQAQFARNGERTVSGARVVGKTVGLRNGQRIVTVATTDGVRRTYRAESLVDGMAGRKDLLAGPVGGRRGDDRPARIGRGDGESPGDRHSRLIESITYNTAVGRGRR